MRVICGQKIPTAIARQITQISPWGWNPALRTDLLNVGISSVALPSADELQSLRRLASRQTAVNVWKNILTEAGASCPDYASRLNTLAPAFFTDSGEAVDYARNRREGVAIKLPWSSSGRGVFLCRPDEMQTIEVRINQCISSQGAVEIEPLWPKSLDFATEWICRDGAARFLGFSLFSCDSAGKYLGNLVAPEDAKISMITEHCRPEILALAVNLLEKSLNSLIAPHYSGPLGVDMLVSADGLINPCVEINLRQTMGHVSLSLRAFSSRKFIFIPGEPLPAN